MSRSFKSVLDETYDMVDRDGMLPSWYTDQLFALYKTHKAELKEAMHGFFDELGFDQLDPGELSERSIRCHELNCDREGLMRRLTEYYENPPRVNRQFGLIEVSQQVPTLLDVLHIIMYPNNEWSFNDLYHRLMYLLGGDLGE